MKAFVLLATIIVFVLLYLSTQENSLISFQKHVTKVMVKFHKNGTTEHQLQSQEGYNGIQHSSTVSWSTFHNYSNLYKEFNKSETQRNDFDTDNKQRITTMHQACSHHGLDKSGKDPLHQPKGWEYFIAEQKELKLVWCNVFKSASTSWMYIFNRLAGFTKSEIKKKSIPPVTLARQKYPRPSKEKLISTLSSPNAIGFLIARNPYERLVSAYRDKIVGAFLGSYHDKISKQILVKYRHIDPKSYRHGRTVPTFEEFVRHVLDEYRTGNELDMHWAPVYSFCNPCQVNLTHIIKFETFDRDTSRILKMAKIEYLLPSGRKLKNQNMSKGSKNSYSLVNKYTKELSSELLKGLLDLYGVDFDLFGYNRQTKSPILPT